MYSLLAFIIGLFEVPFMSLQQIDVAVLLMRNSQIFAAKKPYRMHRRQVVYHNKAFTSNKDVHTGLSSNISTHPISLCQNFSSAPTRTMHPRNIAYHPFGLHPSAMQIFMESMLQLEGTIMTMKNHSLYRKECLCSTLAPAQPTSLRFHANSILRNPMIPTFFCGPALIGELEDSKVRDKAMS